MDALLAEGLVPAVTVTTSHATAGGTLSANALSRFSSAYGKEGCWVEEATIVTPDGGREICRPPRPDVLPDQWTPTERLFMGAVGGLGFVGAFTDITYRVLPVPNGARVQTVVQRYRDLGRFAHDLQEEARCAEARPPDPFDPDKRDAIYGAVYTDRRGRRQAMLFKSSYTSKTGPPTLIHQPEHWARPWVERALSTRLNRLVWLVGFWVLPARKCWVDPVRSFAFFQDGNVRAMKRFEELKILQQTYVIARSDLASWLDAAARHFAGAHVHPTLQDVVALPKDRPFCLTVTPQKAAFAVTYSFLTTDMAKVEAIGTSLAGLSEIALHPYGGRVSLVKNVFADRQTVRNMFGSQVTAFAALRKDVGADRVLVNDFFGDTLG
jgi:decaprenylphospho-beta-D-ribofuranose 2-oxidase